MFCGAIMEEELEALDVCLERALAEIRAQHCVALETSDLQARRDQLKLLSNSLRTFCWLEAQSRSLHKQLV
jgi:hypothetical protein